MAEPTWRQVYAPRIAKIIEENKHLDLKVLKKLLREANPGYYGHHKKTWANEYMRQLGLSKKKSTFVEAKGQMKLF